jgi:hypothetical protein
MVPCTGPFASSIQIPFNDAFQAPVLSVGLVTAKIPPNSWGPPEPSTNKPTYRAKAIIAQIGKVD